jgi:hypothetical protein
MLVKLGQYDTCRQEYCRNGTVDARSITGYYIPMDRMEGHERRTSSRSTISVCVTGIDARKLSAVLENAIRSLPRLISKVRHTGFQDIYITGIRRWNEAVHSNKSKNTEWRTLSVAIHKAYTEQHIGKGFPTTMDGYDGAEDNNASWIWSCRSTRR